MDKKYFPTGFELHGQPLDAEKRSKFMNRYVRFCLYSNRKYAPQKG